MTYFTNDYESKTFLGLKEGKFAYKGRQSGGAATLTSVKHYVENNEIDSQGRTCLTAVTDGKEDKLFIINTYASQKQHKTQGAYFQEV